PGVVAAWLQTKFRLWETAEPFDAPHTVSELVWLTLTSTVLVELLSAGSASVHAPETTVPPLGVQDSAPIVAWQLPVPSSRHVSPAVRLVAMTSWYRRGAVAVKLTV